MSTQYNGQPSLVTAAAALVINSSTNATPIVVSTTNPHNLSDGDLVQITGHATNTQANGIRKVSIASASTVRLLDPVTGADIAGNGVGGATGNMVPFTSSTFTLLSDGEPAGASAVAPALETLGDRSAWAFSKLANARVRAQMCQYFVDADGTTLPLASWTDGLTAYPSNAWIVVYGGDAFISVAGDLDVVAGDEIEIDFATTIQTPAGAAFALGLFVHVYDYGTAPNPGVAVKLGGSAVTYPANTAMPARLRWKGGIGFPAPGLTRGKALRVYLGAFNRSGAGAAMSLAGDRHFAAQVWR